MFINTLSKTDKIQKKQSLNRLLILYKALFSLLTLYKRFLYWKPGNNIKMGKKEALVLCLIILVILSYTASAAVIHGTVYDLSLDKAENTVVEINTEPKQQFVSKNSTYFFSVPAGEYTLTAKQYEGNILAANAEENITVKEQGDFVIDLILFPSFEEDEELLAESDFDIDTDLVVEEPNYVWVFIVIAAVIILFFLMRMRGTELIKSRKHMEEEEAAEAEELKKVLLFIKKEGGRTTQKEIRKSFPQSEAKISLILTELEEYEKIKKIKKGRGNIVILKK